MRRYFLLLLGLILITIFLVILPFLLSTSASLKKVQGDIASLPAGARWFSNPSSSILNEDRLLIDLDIASQGQTVYAEPGETLASTCKYQVLAAVNPGEINQGFFIMSWTPTWPPSSEYYIAVWDGISGVYPGVTGNAFFSFQAPTTPGTYYLYWCGEAHYSIQQAVNSYTQDLGVPGTPAHAKIIVEETQETEPQLSGAWSTSGALDSETILHEIDVDSAMAGNQQEVIVPPGGTVEISYNFQMWSSGGPGIIKQALFVYSWASSWPPWDAYTPIYDGGSGGYHPGFYQTDTFSVTAPTKPGEYNIWFCSDAHYSMNLAMQHFTSPPSILPHARIIVEETP